VAGAGFPRLQTRISKGIDRRVRKADCQEDIGNKPASGTEIIKNWVKNTFERQTDCVHVGDSVFRSSMKKIPIAELYRMCEIARKLLDGPHRVGA